MNVHVHVPCIFHMYFVSPPTRVSTCWMLSACTCTVPPWVQLEERLPQTVQSYPALSWSCESQETQPARIQLHTLTFWFNCEFYWINSIKMHVLAINRARYKLLSLLCCEIIHVKFWQCFNLVSWQILIILYLWHWVFNIANFKWELLCQICSPSYLIWL